MKVNGSTFWLGWMTVNWSGHTYVDQHYTSRGRPLDSQLWSQGFLEAIYIGLKVMWTSYLTGMGLGLALNVKQ